MAKIDFSSRANTPAENVLTPIILIVGIVFAVFGIKLKWFRHRLTFNSSASDTPNSNSESTAHVFGLYKRQEIDDGDFRAHLPHQEAPSTSYAPVNSTSASQYVQVKVNNQIKFIPPPPAYTPPTIHQGNIKTTEIRVDHNNNINSKMTPNDKGKDKAKDKSKDNAKDKSKDKDKKAKFIRIKKEEIKKVPKQPTPSPVQVQKPVEVVNTPVFQTMNPALNTPKAAAPVITPPQQQNSNKKNVKEISQPNKPPALPTSPPPALPEIENHAMIAKLNSMPTTFIRLDGFDTNETNDSPPPTIRSVRFNDVYDVDTDNDPLMIKSSYNDPLVIKSSSSSQYTPVYNDKIQVLTLASSDDDLFTKMQPTPRTTGINYLDYQSNHNNVNETDDSESIFDDYELAPLEFLSKQQPKPQPITKATSTTTKMATIKQTAPTTIGSATAAAATVQSIKNETTIQQTNNKSTTMSMAKDERKINDDAAAAAAAADDDNMWDLVAQHRQNVGRKIERDHQGGNVKSGGIIKNTQNTKMMNGIADTKPKTLREMHSQSRENSNKLKIHRQAQNSDSNKAAATSKPKNAVVTNWDELGDEADA